MNREVGILLVERLQLLAQAFQQLLDLFFVGRTLVILIARVGRGRSAAEP